MVILITVVYIFIIVFDLIPLYHKKEKRVFWIYIFLITAAWTLNILVEIGVKIPSPAPPIKNIIKTIVGQ